MWNDKWASHRDGNFYRKSPNNDSHFNLLTYLDKHALPALHLPASFFPDRRVDRGRQNCGGLRQRDAGS